MAKVYNELNKYKNVPLGLVFDKALSDRARFVYVFMACKPNDWDFFLEPMAKEIGYSVDTLRKYMNELIESGWVEKGEQQNEKGKFGAVEYVIKATKKTDTEFFRHGENTILTNNNTKRIIDDKQNKDNKEKEENTNVFPKKNDYKEIVDCWNKHNGNKLGKVTRITPKRKSAIKRALDDNEVDQEQLMRLLKALPFADSWIYNPDKQHKNWKPDFDWWMANTNGWLTKALEGKVHKEHPHTFEIIMNNGVANIQYTPQGRDIWFNEETKSYWSTYNFYDERIYDGYTDEERPDGAEITLNNARGTYKWNSNNKKWERK